MSELVSAELEHRDGMTLRAHPADKCAGEYCTIHNRSNHSMRSFPQLWRTNWGGFMERICPHGIGHPDPDELNVETHVRGHGCDGCCAGAYREETK